MQIKERGVRLFAPEKGGTCQVFNERPMPEDVMPYCAQDAQILPGLYNYYSGKVTPTWEEMMLSASMERIMLTQTVTFNGKGRHMSLAPLGWC